MNPQNTWLAYQIVVGAGTLIIAGFCGVAVAALCRIAEMLEHIRNHLSNK